MISRCRLLIAAIALGSASLAAPALAQEQQQTVEELKAQLAAREQINELLKQRIETLEAELAGRTIPRPPQAQEQPQREAGDPEADTALQRTFVRRGTAVLPPGTVELAPSLVWSHSGGGGFGTVTDDLYGAGLDARVGIAGGWMIGASVPVLHRKLTGGGSSTGIGDVSASVWKSILSPDGKRPSVVASVRYVAPTAKTLASGQAPLGSGFHSLTGKLAAVKTLAPIAFFGDVGYTAFLGEKIRGVDIDRGGIVSVGAGANLAVTPDVTISTGLDFSFAETLKINGVPIAGSRQTRGLLELGAGAVLARNMFLTVGAAIGITADSPDVTVAVSLPIRF